MTIGIDLSSLQGAHRMRGIGYTLLNLINFMPERIKKSHRFVFYYYKDESHMDPLQLLRLDGVTYEVRGLRPVKQVRRRLRGKFGILTGLANQLLALKDLYVGDSRIDDLSGIDYFLQTDQSQSLPKRRRGMKRALIVYDIIPYVLEWDYLWSYKVARLRGDSRKAAARKHAHRWLYAHKIRVNTRRAHRLLVISEHTKQDFVRWIGANPSKMVVTTLGVAEPDTAQASKELVRYRETSWGYLPEVITFDKTTPYILYVGGADSRRKLDDLVAAFNILRAQGENIKLVLSGDSMQGPRNIATDNIRNALLSSSYQDDIVYAGFADDSTRDWLYANCLCFVFPSRYEGFGLPVLEAMVHGAPVICYDNTATREVGQNVPLYVNSPQEIVGEIRHLLGLNRKDYDKIRETNVKHARKFDWQASTGKIFDSLK